MSLTSGISIRDSFMTNTISFVGGGNLARALISGLRKTDFPQAQIVVSNRGREKLLALANDFGITAAETNEAAAEKADILVIAVKPHDVQEVIHEIKHVVQERNPLVISLASGIDMESLDHWLGSSLGIVRTMPNTATLIGKGITVLYANPLCTQDQKEMTECLFKCGGIVTWVAREKDIDLMTPFVGSSIAYLFIFIQAIEKAAVNTGIDPAIVHNLALQTIHGAASLAVETNEPFETLQAQVATRGGVTEPSFSLLENGGLFESLEKAFRLVANRCETLRRSLSHAQSE